MERTTIRDHQKTDVRNYGLNIGEIASPPVLTSAAPINRAIAYGKIKLKNACTDLNSTGISPRRQKASYEQICPAHPRDAYLRTE